MRIEMADKGDDPEEDGGVYRVWFPREGAGLGPLTPKTSGTEACREEGRYCALPTALHEPPASPRPSALPSLALARSETVSGQFFESPTNLEATI